MRCSEGKSASTLVLYPKLNTQSLKFSKSCLLFLCRGMVRCRSSYHLHSRKQGSLYSSAQVKGGKPYLHLFILYIRQISLSVCLSVSKKKPKKTPHVLICCSCLLGCFRGIPVPPHLPA